MVQDDLEAAIGDWRIYGDAVARTTLLSALEAYVDHRIAVHDTKPHTFTELADADYERLLSPPYLGPKRPTCAVCASLMVAGLCSRDAAH